MNCISTAIFPTGTSAAIRRVIEYFYPDDGGKIWIDIFFDNPTATELKLRVLHAGSLNAGDVTEDGWGRQSAAQDPCGAVLSRRIVQLHGKQYCPIEADYRKRTVQLAQEKYKVWTGSIVTLIGNNLSDGDNVPFTMWEIKPFKFGKWIFRLCLTYQQRFARKTSFFAHGEAIILRNIEGGALPAYKGADSCKYRELFAGFKDAHETPEAFEYLIVAPDGAQLSWDARSLSPLVSRQTIHDRRLASTTRWFVSDADNWELRADVDWGPRADVIEVAMRDETRSAGAADESHLVSASSS